MRLMTGRALSISPYTQVEATARQEAVERVRAMVLSIWPQCRFEVHGSFATGMYLPNSDIDAVILGSGAQSPAVCLKAGPGR